MAIEIRETTVETTESGIVVRLHVSDAPLDDAENSSFRLQIVAPLPRLKACYLVQIQREAILEAQQVLRELEKALLQEFPVQVPSRPERF